MRLVQALLGLTLVAWLVCESQQMQMGPPMGPFDIIIQQAIECDDQGTGAGKFFIQLYLGPPDASRRRKRLHRGSFSWPSTNEENDRIEVHGEFFQKKSDTYQLMYKHRGPFCASVALAPEFYNGLRKAIGIAHLEGCNIPMGNYSYKDWEIPLNFPTPMLEYSSYKMTLSMLLDKKVFGCIQVMGDVVPKQ